MANHRDTYRPQEAADWALIIAIAIAFLVVLMDATYWRP